MTVRLKFENISELMEFVSNFGTINTWLYYLLWKNEGEVSPVSTEDVEAALAYCTEKVVRSMRRRQSRPVDNGAYTPPSNALMGGNYGRPGTARVTLASRELRSIWNQVGFVIASEKNGGWETGMHRTHLHTLYEAHDTCYYRTTVGARNAGGGY